MSFLHRGVPLAAAALALAGMAPPADACSICRCGDPTFNALGKDVVSAAGWRFALDWEHFSKTQGPADEQDSVVEQRYTGVLAYTFADRFLLVARVPYSNHSLVETAGTEVERTDTSGLADPEIYGQVRLWSSQFAGDLGRRASVSATFGVKTNWGENNASRDGERLDEHAQPGTGSTDAFFGLSSYYLLDRQSSLFASVQARLPGSNDFGYQYGKIFLANFAYERKLGAKLDAVVELNFRHSDRDEIDATGALDGDTGGTMLYVTPRLLVDVGGGVVLRGAVQIPVVENLYGVQDEKAVYNLGVTFSFGAPR